MAEILRKQLALAVKKIQWSYAIFWSISSQNGEVKENEFIAATRKLSGYYHQQMLVSYMQALEWDDGYYNGDIKTRKTVQAEQLNADELGLQRTEQLRELYESLLDAENNTQSSRPSAALSPEDLTDTEWYFLICMSFVFNIGQGLPGRSLAKNQTTWLCKANYADSKVFNRTLLAKSASIQTVVCFPYSDGVIELGTTELVSEDPSIVQHITSFLETPGAVVSNHSEYVSENSRRGNDTKYVQLDWNVVDDNLNPDTEWEKGNTCSPNSSEEFEPNYQAEESIMAELINDGTSQLQSWQLMDDEISNGVLNSGDSSDCRSQTFIGPEKIVPRQDNKVNEDHLLDLQDSKDMELTSVEIQKDDNHYQGIVSTLLKTSHQLIMGPCYKSITKDSCFVRWKKGRSPCKHKSGGTSQRLLKKVLYEVSLMHGDGKIRKPEMQEIDANHASEERRQRETMQEKFMILRSITPSTAKVDDLSLVDDTIEYLRNLEKKVEGLESQKELVDVETRRRKRSCNVIESTFSNYCDKRVNNCKKQVLKKRKGSGFNNMNAVNQFYHEDNMTDDVKVSKTEKGIVIEIKCPWREKLFVDIMGTVSNLHLDFHSVQSSNTDGNLSLTIHSKVKGSTMPSVKVIRQALQRVTRKS